MSDTLDLKSGDKGTLLRVRVVPRSSRTQLDGVKDGALHVRLNAPPVDGAANKALREILAKSLKCPRGAIEIVRGERSRDKTIMIYQMDPAAIRRVLERTQ